MEVPKRKPKTQTERGAGEQLANLELRAALDPYLENNPVARLGYDVLMRGYVPGEGPSGKIYSMIGTRDTSDDEKLFDLMGFFRSKGDPRDSRKKPITDQMKRQGVEFDPDAGSTVYFQQTSGEDYGMGGLETLMHELAHVGFQYLVDQKDSLVEEVQLGTSTEEFLADLMERRSREKLDRPLDEKHELARDLGFGEMLSRFDASANTAMRQRGMPPQAVRRPVKAPEPKEPTFAEKLMGLFGG